MNQSVGACPVCGGELSVTEYTCGECGVSLRGRFKRCDLCNLPKDLLHFVRVFLNCQGNMKEVEKVLGVSYPTIKSRLAKVNQMLTLGEFSGYLQTQERLDLLKSFKEGKLSMDEVLKRL